MCNGQYRRHVIMAQPSFPVKGKYTACTCMLNKLTNKLSIDGISSCMQIFFEFLAQVLNILQWKWSQTFLNIEANYINNSFPEGAQV